MYKYKHCGINSWPSSRSLSQGSFDTRIMAKSAYPQQNKNNGILHDTILLNDILLTNYSVQDLPKIELFLYFQ